LFSPGTHGGARRSQFTSRSIRNRVPRHSREVAPPGAGGRARIGAGRHPGERCPAGRPAAAESAVVTALGSVGAPG